MKREFQDRLQRVRPDRSFFDEINRLRDERKANRSRAPELESLRGESGTDESAWADKSSPKTSLFGRVEPGTRLGLRKGITYCGREATSQNQCSASETDSSKTKRGRVGTKGRLHLRMQRGRHRWLSRKNTTGEKINNRRISASVWKRIVTSERLGVSSE